MCAAGFGGGTETPCSSESLIMPLLLVLKEIPITSLSGTFQVQEEDMAILFISEQWYVYGF